MNTNQIAPWAMVPNPYIYSMDTIILPHQLVRLEPCFKALGHKWRIKDEFHVSLITIKKIVPSVIQNNDIAEKAALGLVMNVTNKVLTLYKPQFLKFTNEFRLVTKEDRKTIVAMCEVSNLEELYDELNAQLDLNIEVPPTHITLYTLENQQAIGLASKKDLDTLTTKLTEQMLLDIRLKMNFPNTNV